MGKPGGRMSGRKRVKAAKAEPEIVTRNGKAVSVIRPIKAYEEFSSDPKMPRMLPG
jgi:hypothetical protein